MLYVICVVVVAGQLVNADLEQQLALASVEFSQRLYQEVTLNESNVVYSPFSIHSALAMTLLGAQGETATEMKNSLGVAPLGDEVHGAYQNLNSQFSSESKVQLHFANAIYVGPSYQIVPKFIEDASRNYFARVDYINASADGGPEQPINDYIVNKTMNMIKQAVPPGIIGSQTVMVLVNAISFDGVWRKPFDQNFTKLEDFHQLGGAVKQVEMMHVSVEKFRIKRDDANGVDVAELPFRGGRFSMYIALPQQVDGITDLDAMITRPGKIHELFTNLVYESFHLALPKFKIESALSLIPALEKLGMSKVFTPVMAELSGITTDDNLYIGIILHKAAIEVQETGTVASAGTLTVTMLNSYVEPTGNFTADHPFLFFLRDQHTGQVLFQGKFSG